MQMEGVEKSRTKFFEESKFDPTNQKYGLFSYPGTLAVSKSPYFQEQKRRRDKDGNVDCGPKNFTTCWPKSGKGPDALFSLPEGKSEQQVSIGSVHRMEKERVKKMLKVHDSNWKHPGAITEKLSPFEHVEGRAEIKLVKNFKDGVPVGPKNFLTSPMKKGSASVTPGITFSRYPEHLPDPYDLKDAKGKMKKALKGVKIANHDSPFKSTDFGMRTFDKDISLYGGEFKRPSKNKRVLTQSVSFKHDQPFKSSSVPREFFSPHPEYIPNPLPKLYRKAPSDSQPWKTTISARSTPTPSISFNSKNLRSEFSTLKNF